MTDDFHCEGGHFIIRSYKLYVDFGRCDGVVEIISRAKTNYHATSLSSRLEGFTHVGTSTEIPQSLVDRVKLLMQCQGIHLCEHRVESGEWRAVVGERKIGYLVVTSLEKEPLKPWKSRRVGSKFSLKLAKKTPKPWNIPSKIVK